MQTNPAVEQSKIIRWYESPCNQSGRYTHTYIQLKSANASFTEKKLSNALQ